MSLWVSGCIFQIIIVLIAPIDRGKAAIAADAAITLCPNCEDIRETEMTPAGKNTPFETADSSAAGYPNENGKKEFGPVLHVKFSADADLEEPYKQLPYDVRKYVVRSRRLSTLTDRQLEKIGAGRFKWWFEITLKPETPLKAVMEELQRLDYIEVVEQAPRPAPPP